MPSSLSKTTFEFPRVNHCPLETQLYARRHNRTWSAVSVVCPALSSDEATATKPNKINPLAAATLTRASYPDVDTTPIAPTRRRRRRHTFTTSSPCSSSDRVSLSTHQSAGSDKGSFVVGARKSVVPAPSLPIPQSSVVTRLTLRNWREFVRADWQDWDNIQKLHRNACPVLKAVATVHTGFRMQLISFNFGFSKSLAGSRTVINFWNGRLDHPTSSSVFSCD
jgi:hypothetical protein